MISAKTQLPATTAEENRHRRLSSVVRRLCSPEMGMWHSVAFEMKNTKDEEKEIFEARSEGDRPQDSAVKRERV